LKDDAKIKPGSEINLIDEIQNPKDDIYKKIEYDRKINEQCLQRFTRFIKDNLATLNEWGGTSLSETDIMAEFEWAWMNLCTRCFGYHHLPNDIAMCPLMDQVNHAEEQATVRFFLFPWQVNRKMLEIEIDKRTNHEMMIDLHFEAMGVK
jgi:hypothetical protein